MTAHNAAPSTFDALPLPPSVLETVRALGYETPTPIQDATIPPLIEGRDVVGQAQTGTGKTAAFALPLLSQLDPALKATQVLVLTPTRELAIQVAEAFDQYGRSIQGLNVLPIYGGQEYGGQIRGLRRGSQVVVGTPGRVMDHMRKGTLKLDNLSAIVLDEADEMLHMGFIDDVEWVLERCPEERQIALFSATMPPSIRRIAQTYLKNPKEISMESRSTAAQTISQFYCVVPPAHKVDALLRILEGETLDGVIIFARTKTDTVEINEKLMAAGLRSRALNGDIAQNQRERIVDQLKNEQINIIVATDVAARGLDVPRISHVINFDPPRNAEGYVHRIGRTGRAGRDGKAILFLSPRDRRTLVQIERTTKQKIQPLELPSVEAINSARVDRFAAGVLNNLDRGNSRLYRGIVKKILKTDPELDPVDVAAALASMVQGKRPLLLEDLPFNKTFKEDREKKQNSRSRTCGAPRKGDENMETYRVQIGAVHGVQKGNLVGAIANEADLNSEFIGRIEIFKEFSTVDLPKGMPKEVFNLLKGVRVCQRPLNIRRAESKQISVQGARPQENTKGRRVPKLRNSGTGRKHPILKSKKRKAKQRRAGA